ncbi:MAG: tripartite tricarboxylate transporter TctB family protein [Kordiimonadaceae bacterium]|nr:tripartite tricarboxylate transporter TctB family protein [Kordiimonadaceae bacterium]
MFINATFEIKAPLFGQMSSALWPRIILVSLTLLSILFLIRSLRLEKPEWEQKGSLKNWFRYYKNPIYCFGLFFLFLASLPYLGMLLAGVTFVFLMLSMLGGWAPKKLLLHASVAILFVGMMWSIFTFVLGVILPQGEIFLYM